MADFVVYSTSDTPYQRWQCDLLEQTFQWVGQSGRLICLCSASEHEDLPPSRSSDVAEVVSLPSYMRDEATGDMWGIANKFNSLKAWIDKPAIDGSVMLLDPDMLFFRAVAFDVAPGEVIGQRWVDRNIAQHPIFDRYCRCNRERIDEDFVFMYPYVMHTEEIRRTIDRYIELCYEIRANEGVWEADMYALVIVAAEYGLQVRTEQIAPCNNWPEFNELDTPMVHYPTRFLDREGASIWFKQEYTPSTQKTGQETPWQRPVAVERAASRLEGRVLETLHRYINQQQIELAGADLFYWEKYRNRAPSTPRATDRYLVFNFWPGGFNNLRMSLELAAVLALLLDRTLVLPPRQHYYLLKGESEMGEFFALAELGDAAIPFEEYCRRQGISLDDPIKTVWARIGERAYPADWNVVEHMMVVPRDAERSEYFERYRQGRPLKGFSDEALAAESILFYENLLGNFYLTIYAENRLAEMTAYVAETIHYNPTLFLEAWNVIRHLGDRGYAAIHIRRNDFQYKHLFIDGEAILRNIEGVLRDGETLYVATDADDKGFLAPLAARYRLVFYQDVESLITPHLHYNLIGCIEQLICTRARLFIGNQLSTFSSYIYRMRGYMADIADKRYYDNTNECRPDGTPPALSPSWSAGLASSWEREFPEGWAFQEEEIFVSIASYRDPELVPTITDLLANADRPDRLCVGVCMQDTEGELLAFPFEGHPRVRVLKLPYEEGQGVGYARSLIQRHLFKGERYFMQIDSHMRFAPGWDSDLKGMLGRCAATKPIISSYPHPYTPGDEEGSYLEATLAPRMVYKGFDGNGCMMVIGQDVIEEGDPTPSLWLAAGFLFTYGSWVNEVPYDPKIYFKGEEDSLLIRSYTHGWDLFSPSRNVLFHEYNDVSSDETRSERPLHWEDHGQKFIDYGFLHLLQAGVGIGPERTIEEYQRHFGVDFERRAIAQRTRRGLAGEQPEMVAHSFTLNTEGLERRDDYRTWVFALLDAEGEEIHRDDIYEHAVLNLQNNLYTIDDPELLAKGPTQYVLWPLLHDGTFLERRQEPIEWLRPTGEARTFALNTEGLEPRDDYQTWVFALLDAEGVEIHRDDIYDPAVLGLRNNRYTIDDPVLLAKGPTQYVLWPMLEDGTFLERRQEPIEWLRPKSEEKEGVRFLALNTEGLERRDDYQTWVFALLDAAGEQIHRDDIYDPAVLNLMHNIYTVDDPELLAKGPVQYVLWPMLKDGTFLERRQERIRWL